MSYRVDKKSSLCKQNHYPSRTISRWSEPILQRRRALADSDTSAITEREDDTDSPPPPEDLLPPTPASILKHNSCCCSTSRCNQVQRNHCHASIKERDKAKKTLEEKILKENELRGKLEEKLCKNEVDDAITAEQQNTLQSRLHRMDTLLQAFGAYVNCLGLLDKAANRLHKLTIGFANKDLDPDVMYTTTNKLIESESHEKITSIKNFLNSQLTPTQNINCTLDDYKKKKSDFTLASNNFNQFLHSGARASISQLKKLEQQYDTIQLKYQNSSMTLNQELPKCINERKNTLSQCINELIPVSDEIFEKESQLNGLLIEINNLLQEKSNKNSAASNSNKKTYPKNYSQANTEEKSLQKNSKPLTQR